MPVELDHGFIGPGKTAPVMSHPDPGQDNGQETGHLKGVGGAKHKNVIMYI